MEVDGSCVAEMDSDDEDSSGTSEDEGLPYGACPGMSDVECAEDTEQCRAAVNGCTSRCAEDRDCAIPDSGTAVPRCEIVLEETAWYNACVLGCGSDVGCPAGMVCNPIQISLDGYGETRTEFEACVWP